MNTKLKITAGVIAGLVAGATLVGTAIASPNITGTSTPYRSMMGSYASTTSTPAPTWSQMQSFMNQYRDASGAIDYTRMHADVTSGKVKPPCVGTKASRAKGSTSGATSDPSGATTSSLRTVSNMMQGVSVGSGTTGNSMMGTTY